MPDNSQITNLEFPNGGIDVSGEFQEQPPGTTPEAVNVRGVNPDTLRERGGSRAGLIQYIPGPLFAGADLIQHLNIIVDPTGPALGQNFVVPDDTWVEDPGNPGQFVPPGGWGWQPNPNLPPNQPPTDIAQVQKKSGFDTINAVSTGDFNVVFDANPVSGHLLVIAVASTEQDLAATGEDVVTVTVTNGAAGAYTQIGSYVSANGTVTSSGVTVYRRISLWYRVSTGVVADKTVTIDYSPDTLTDNVADVRAFCIEYKNTDASPFNASATRNSNAAISSLSIGPVSLTSRGLLIVAIASDIGQGGLPITVSPFMTRQFPITNTLNLFDRHPLSVPTTETFSFTFLGYDSGAGIAMISASFKKAP